MNHRKLLQKNIIGILFVLASHLVNGQVQIAGTVYDISERYAMPGVSVMGTSGLGTATDSLGHYSIRLRSTDSIYFSYLGKLTAKFPVKDIEAPLSFDMSLQVAIDSLPWVLVRPKDHRMDSLENRIEYKKVFNYSPSYIENTKMGRNDGVGTGLDLDMLFNGKATRRMLVFQQRLEQDEKVGYIDRRFTRGLVKKITGLESPALDSFMRTYRPSYEVVQSFSTDYEFYQYIQDWGKTFSEMWKRDHVSRKEAK